MTSTVASDSSITEKKYIRSGQPLLMLDSNTRTVVLTAWNISYILGLGETMKLSGKEIVELEKLDSVSDTKIYNGDIIYIRYHHQYARGQMTSSYLEWSSTKDSKSQFVVKQINGSVQDDGQPLCESSSFELISKHWPNLTIGRCMEDPPFESPPFHPSVFFGYFCIGSSTKSWFIPTTFQCVPVTGDERLPLNFQPSRNYSNPMLVSFGCTRCGAIISFSGCGNQIIGCGNCLHMCRAPRVLLARPGFSPIIGASLARSVTVPVTSTYTFLISQNPRDGGDQYCCPHCGSIFMDSLEIIKHVDRMHSH